MIVRAMVQPIPPDNTGGADLPTHEVRAEAATYEDALAQLREQVDDGERIIAILGAGRA